MEVPTGQVRASDLKGLLAMLVENLIARLSTVLLVCSDVKDALTRSGSLWEEFGAKL